MSVQVSHSRPIRFLTACMWLTQCIQSAARKWCRVFILGRMDRLFIRLVHSTKTELNESVNGLTGIHVLRTNRALTVLVSLQPIKP